VRAATWQLVNRTSTPCRCKITRSDISRRPVVILETDGLPRKSLRRRHECDFRTASRAWSRSRSANAMRTLPERTRHNRDQGAMLRGILRVQGMPRRTGGSSNRAVVSKRLRHACDSVWRVRRAAHDRRISEEREHVPRMRREIQPALQPAPSLLFCRSGINASAA